MSDRREQYRVDTSLAAIESVRLRAVDGPHFDCRLVDATAEGASIAARRDASSELERHRPVQLEISHGDVPEPVVLSGVVEHVHLFNGYVRYGIRFTSHHLESVLPPPLWEMFNRRVEPRLSFGEHSPVGVTVRQDGHDAVEGVVRDVSPIGMRIALPAADCEGLGSSFTASYQLAGRPMCFAVTVANVEQTGFVVELGLHYDADATQDFDGQREFLADFLATVLVGQPAAA